jgi:hypothetical protein
VWLPGSQTPYTYFGSTSRIRAAPRIPISAVPPRLASPLAASARSRLGAFALVPAPQPGEPEPECRVQVGAARRPFAADLGVAARVTRGGRIRQSKGSRR